MNVFFETFLAVMSFPFWFVGLVFVGASLTGAVKVNNIPADKLTHYAVFVVGIILCAIGYVMV